MNAPTRSTPLTSPHVAVERAFQPWAKVFVAEVDRAAFDPIRIFHRWIQRDRVDELLLDVHDYRHVHHGPGVILVAHGCILGLDETAGQLGLAYKTRRGPTLPAADALRRAAARALTAAQYLEEDAAGAVRFATHEVELGFDDRLHTPRRHEVVETLTPVAEGLGSTLFDGPTVVEESGEALGCLRLRVRAVGAPPTLSVLRERAERAASSST